MRSLWWILGPALLVLLAALFVTPASPPAFLLFLGRFHPTLVHLPIGILLLGVLVEVLARSPRFAPARAAVPVILFAGALSAVAAAVAGLFLARGGGYDAATLAWHQRLGVAAAVAAVLAFALHARAVRSPASRTRRAYVGVLGVLCVCLVAGGHLGGTLTHGPGYLTRYLPAPLRDLLGDPADADAVLADVEALEDAVVYTHLVQPILNRHCTACHNPSKQKGGLALDTAQGLREGGDDGPVVAAGRPYESTMIRRLWLPPGHDDRMPPADRPPLSVAEAELIRWWIDQGASFDQTLADAEVTPAVQIFFDALGLAERKTGIFALDNVPPPDSTALRALGDLGVSVRPLGEALPYVEVHTTNVTASVGRDHLEALRPLASQVAWLNLARTPVTDDDLAVLADLPHLTRLHLEQTQVTDASLAYLKDLAYLEYLNLYGTRVTDAGLDHLRTLPSLRALYLWQTGVTREAADRLQHDRPGLEVTLGQTGDAATR